MLDPTCCIRLATSFDTFQQRQTMLDPVARPVWINQKILEIFTQRDTSIIRNLKMLPRIRFPGFDGITHRRTRVYGRYAPDLYGENVHFQIFRALPS